MPKVTLINRFGKIAGWNNATMNVLNRDVEGITEIEYSDDQQMENEYGAGAYPIGQSDGNYAAKASVTLYMEELIALQQSLAPGMRIQDVPGFDIPVVYEYGGKIVKDIIRNCRFKNNGRSLKQNDGKILQKIELLTSHIQWSV